MFAGITVLRTGIFGLTRLKKHLNGYQLLIENSLGQPMFQTAINQQSSYICLNGWTGNGLYFVHIIDPQGNTVDVRKIVLQ